ncbi:MarR family winged helix-turn-helix transcriptional regulator [Nonomuraea soli]|uniref:DNA-binding MarR family transcriptional regulator n=1 Tax=Nonomuraea soli TaxID=1032476 RepID=A0A7W0HPD9_9ACTN|nr:MarR family transcriptional regulator [Nonomuraea soli]MBA2890768.1 DNA-binding MarR family transcriptional regulator [Nonomuraea soli]
MTRSGPHDQAARDAWAAYRRLQLLVDAEVARDLERDSGLSMADYEVLAAAAGLASAETCVRVGGLAAKLQWAHGRLSRQLGRMERRGLIAREACELDGRGDDVLLTGAGRQAYEEATPGHLASIERHFGRALTGAQLAALVDIERAVAAGSRSTA